MKPKKIRVAVVMGGPSAEYEVSLNTGKMVLKNLDRKKYQTKAVLVKRNGEWPISFQKLKNDFDICFIAMHGEYGEDGTLQKVLNKYKIPYTGSGAKASQLGMDKLKSFRIFEKADLAVPKYQVIKNAQAKIKLNPPLVVKPLDRGSSVGLTIIKSKMEIAEGLKNAFQYSKTAIVQKYVSGREFTCGVLEIKGRAKPLPVIEIVPLKREFFDYYSKYTAGASEEITPAKISKALAKKIQAAALKAHQSIGAAGYSRTDFILAKDGTLYILEINTLPGLTQESLLPKSARAKGITFSKLLDLIIEAGLQKRYS